MRRARNAFTTGQHELLGLIDHNAYIVIVDVRLPADFRKAHVPGTVILPKGRWEKRAEAARLSKNNLNVQYCHNQQCHLASEAGALLVQQGYPVIEIEGGFATWEAFNHIVFAAEEAGGVLLILGWKTRVISTAA